MISIPSHQDMLPGDHQFPLNGGITQKIHFGFIAQLHAIQGLHQEWFQDHKLS
jgi:hypothetical protein